LRNIIPKRLSASFAVLVLLAAPASGQVRNAKQLSRVPTELRDRLVKRLELFIQYDRAHEYERQFDLLSRSYLESNKFSRESYVEFKRKEVRGTLLEVKLHNATIDLKRGVVRLPVAAKTKYEGKVVDDSWIINAYLQDGEWYFDYTWVEV